MQAVAGGGQRPSKEFLLRPIPLAPCGMPGSGGGGGAGAAAAGGARGAGKRTASFNGAGGGASSAAAAAAAAERQVAGGDAADSAAAAGAKAKKLPPKLAVALPGAPQLPANFPATPTAHAALAGGLQKREAPAAATSVSASGGSGGGPPLTTSGRGGSPSPTAFSRFADERASGSGGGLPSVASPTPAAKRLSHLSEVGHAGDPLPAPRAASPSPPPVASGGAALRPSLKVALPADDGAAHAAGFGGGSSDGLCYSPSTPAAKGGMKERVKFYFQRQAGSAGGL